MDFPTHLRNDGSLGSPLDLVLVSDRSLVSDVSSLSPVGGSDHVVVRCCLSVRPKLLPPATRLRRVWKYEDVDLEKVNGLLSHLDWSSVTSVSPVDSAWGISGGRSLYLLSRNMCHPS